ncbi:uncharacterized protein LOC132657518 [Ovis aries]|uniref:uncharacterized protein LOC132657518 n=1 Tax=Ovis aries TaxID=9940 RepID=UPI00295280E1|nr:uncharacterized protein LOC132657518 [Ovis aries]
MVSKLKSLEPTAETKRARQWLGPRAKQHSSHDYSCSRGPKGPTRCSELLFPLLTLPARGEHSTIGRGKIETQGSSGEETTVRCLRWEDPLPKGVSYHLACRTRPRGRKASDRTVCACMHVSQGIAKKPRNHSATYTAIRSNGFFGQPALGGCLDVSRLVEGPSVPAPPTSSTVVILQRPKGRCLRPSSGETLPKRRRRCARGPSAAASEAAAVAGWAPPPTGPSERGEETRSWGRRGGTR